MEMELTEVMKLVNEAVKAERKEISENVLEMQGTSSQFRSSSECIRYNKVIRDVAEQILKM
jgi:uncharacterized protein with von Willebrand factor type A (vWA) domain